MPHWGNKMALRMISAAVHAIETPHTFDLLEKGDKNYRPLVIQQIPGATQI